MITLGPLVIKWGRFNYDRDRYFMIMVKSYGLIVEISTWRKPYLHAWYGKLV